MKRKDVIKQLQKMHRQADIMVDMNRQDFPSHSIYNEGRRSAFLAAIQFLEEDS